MFLVYSEEQISWSERMLFCIVDSQQMGVPWRVCTDHKVSATNVTFPNKVHSCEIRNALNVEPLLPSIERSQLRWFGHVNWTPQERLVKQVLLLPTGTRTWGRTRTRWDDYISDLVPSRPWFGASRSIWDCRKPWSYFESSLSCCFCEPPERKSRYEN